jgi:hypothetical protein
MIYWVYECEHGKRCNFKHDCPECAKDEIESLRTQLAAAQKDAERLNSGMLKLKHRDEFGDDYTCLYTGLDLRAAIDQAMQEER